MSWMTVNPGILAALAAAVLFGLGAPLAKSLLLGTDTWLLAGLLYLGAGLGLMVLRWIRASARIKPRGAERWYLVGAIAAGGLIAPVLLMQGLARMPASGASLLLNAEGVFTALLAWFVFRENVDRRVALGMVAIAAGAACLAWTSQLSLQGIGPSLFILAACLAWAVDNNLTRRIALLDPTWLAAIKGLTAGAINLLIATTLGAHWPEPQYALGGVIVGAFAYGASLALFIVGLRHLGAARTTAYFSIAPFVGASGALLWLREPLTVQFVLAAALMGVGVWLHLTERHEHTHDHASLEHEHMHVHDAHHQHTHSTDVAPGTRHAHKHRHAPLTHNHPHYPDAHHHHDHNDRNNDSGLV